MRKKTSGHKLLNPPRENLTDLLRLVEYGVEVPEPPRAGELPEDLAEELLGVHAAGLAAPVLLPAAAAVAARPPLAAEAGRTVRVVLLPLALVTQDLDHVMRGKR